ncbi:MAG: TetR/AcrR family transcriptional regulator [Deltaproteobacteria bacterium]|nr:TetR/AcrR family transcriptional regulator [Candidatus Zymogenaceae bacterium]
MTFPKDTPNASLDLERDMERYGETERRILMASVKIFSEKGFDGSRTDEIAKLAGVNKAMIHYYFESKERLYVTLISLVFKRLSLILREYFEDISPETVEEDISHFVDRYFEFLRANTKFFKMLLWELARGGEQIGKVMKEIIGEQFVALQSQLKEAMQKGYIRTLDPRHMMLSIIATVLFYFISRPIITHLWGEDPLSDENIALRKREVKKIILRGILPDGTDPQ